MKKVFCGLESSGKTLKIAQLTKELCVRNQKWQIKYGFTRKIYSNLKFSKEFFDKYQDFIVYWKDMREVINKTGIDIIWDEISSDFSAMKKEPMPKIVNRWLRQGAKQGVHIYATAQEFHDIHLDFRRRVFSAYKMTKLMGSRRSGDDLPPVKRIWGVCMMREYKINPYNELEPEFSGLIPSFVLITRDLCNIFDTHQLITDSEDLPFQHIERRCLVCGYHKVFHR